MGFHIKFLFYEMRRAFGQTLDRMGKWQGEESPGLKHKKITLHSCRRQAKSIISDLGLSDCGEWLIGHHGSTCYRGSDKVINFSNENEIHCSSVSASLSINESSYRYPSFRAVKNDLLGTG